MARPIKNGLDYFPMDVVCNDKIELIEAEFGLTGFATVVKLFQKIYGERGYYCEWTDEVALLFGKKNGLGSNVVSEIVAWIAPKSLCVVKSMDGFSPIA